MTTNNPTHQTRINLGNTDTYVRRDGSDMKFKDGNNSEVTLTDLQSGGGLDGGGVFALNLRCYNNATNPDYQVDVESDKIGLRDKNGNSIILSSISETFDISTDLDTGSESSFTWYYLWLVSTNGTSITDTVVSANKDSPQGSFFNNAYYTLRVLSIFNDGSSNLRRIDKYSTRVQYYNSSADAIGFQIASGDTGGSWSSVSVTTYLPPNCKRCYGTIRSRTGSGNPAGGAAPQALDATSPGEFDDGIPGAHCNDTSVSVSSGQGMFIAFHWEVEIQTAQTVYWVTDTSSNPVLRITGYEDEITSA